jgi:hypothetical protein
MPTLVDTIPPLNSKAPCAANLLNPAQRQQIAIQAAAQTINITDLAKSHGTSRKFIYQLKEKAEDALEQTFSPKKPEESDLVLFYLPITKKWIAQFVIALILIARCSYQGVAEILRDVFNYDTCKGTIHNIMYKALAQSKVINRQQDLSGITVGVHDEIYQAGNPVLAGVCAHTTYCYLLSLEETCDANVWGVHLLDLKKEQNLNPNKTIADGGPSARKGQKDAWPETPCGGDVFHALHPFGKLCHYQDNRAIDSFNAVEALKHKIDCPRGKWKQDGNHQELLRRLAAAEALYLKASQLSSDLNTLKQWLKRDILSLRGPSYEDRRQLLEFVVEELRLREDMCKHRIEPVRKYLENHKDNLLEFVPEMEKLFKKVAIEYEVALADVESIAKLRRLSTQERWEEYAILRGRLKEKFHLIEMAVDEILDSIVRASSLVENLNSRLRNYFTLRRHLGNDYLEILRFFLNHRRFMRSEYQERVGHSPAELLTGEMHKHWLEMLGFDLFKQAA